MCLILQTQDSMEWLQQEKKTIPENPSTLENAGVLMNLQPGSKYVVRVVLFDKSADMYQKENVQETSFVTDCKRKSNMFYHHYLYTLYTLNTKVISICSTPC